LDVKKNSRTLIYYGLGSVTICLWAAILYWETLHSPFHFDDKLYIVQNHTIRDITDIQAIWRALNRPSRFVTFFSFALNFYLHEYRVFGYHLFNLFIHVGNTFFVWWFTRLLFSTPRMVNEKVTKNSKSIALVTALLFLSHPIQTQAISYVVQRFAALATFFYLLTACLYLKGRISEGINLKVMCLFASGCTAILAMFTKEVAFTLPFSIILIELIFFSRKDTNWKHILKSKIFYFLPIFLFTFFIPTFYKFNFLKIFGKQVSGSHNFDILTPWTYFLTQTRVIVTYIKLFLFPIGQNLEYDFPMSHHLFEWDTLLSFTALTLILVVGFLLYHHRVILAFGIFWFFLCLSVESSFIPIHHVIYEHRAYLPSFGIFLLMSVLLFSGIKNSRHKTITITIIILTLSYLTYQRNKIWSDDLALWKDVAKKSPNLSLPFVNVGAAYVELEKYDEALPYYNRAIAISPRFVKIYNNRGVVFEKKKRFDLALKDYTTALSIDPHSAHAYVNRGVTLEMMGKLDLALQDYNNAIKYRPYLEVAYSNRGVIYEKMGKFDLSIESHSQALAINSTYVRGYVNRAIVFSKMGKHDFALADYNRVIQLEPNFPEYYNNRGVILKDLGQHKLALEDYNKAIAFNPNYTRAYLNRGVSYENLKKYNDALADYQKVLQIDPTMSQAYNNIGVIHKLRGDDNVAIEYYNKALALNPRLIQSYNNRGAVYHGLGDFESALKDYDKAIAINPRFFQAIYNKGVIFLAQKKYVLAMEQFDSVVKINPKFPLAYFKRGEVYLALQQVEKALREYNYLIKVNPKNSRAYFMRSQILLAQGKVEEALQDALTARRLGLDIKQEFFKQYQK